MITLASRMRNRLQKKIGFWKKADESFFLVFRYQFAFGKRAPTKIKMTTTIPIPERELQNF